MTETSIDQLHSVSRVLAWRCLLCPPVANTATKMSATRKTNRVPPMMRGVPGSASAPKLVSVMSQNATAWASRAATTSPASSTVNRVATRPV